MTLGNVLALLAAVCCGSLALRARIPAGAMVGALFGVTLFNVITGMAVFPTEVRVFAQMLAGGFIGMGITREIVRSLKSLAGAALLLCLSMLVMGFTVGLLLVAFSGFNVATCLLAAAPGGLSDLSLIAPDLGADPSKVVSIHLVRLLSVLCICPALNRAVMKRFYPDEQRAEAPPPSSSETPHVIHPPRVYPAEGGRLEKLRWLAGKNALTILVAMAGGMIGWYLGIPAGVLILSMAAVGALNILTGRGYMSRPVGRFAQMLAGAMIGQSIGVEELRRMKEIALPALLLVVCYLAGSQLIAWMMHRFCHVDIMTALFSATPAGASDMALIAADLGGNSPLIAMLHVARLVGVIVIFPQVTYLILHFTGG